MRRFIFPRISNNVITGSLLILSLILCTSASYSQSAVDFSGTWTQDAVKSDDFYKEFGVVLVINQTPQTIAVKQTFLDKDGKEITTREFSFNLDGKEVSKEEQGGINKESATWSADKKTLTTKSTRTVGTDVYGSTAAYTLSDDGLVMTVQTKDINPLGMSVKQVFNKKQ